MSWLSWNQDIERRAGHSPLWYWSWIDCLQAVGLHQYIYMVQQLRICWYFLQKIARTLESPFIHCSRAGIIYASDKANLKMGKLQITTDFFDFICKMLPKDSIGITKSPFNMNSWYNSQATLHRIWERYTMWTMWSFLTAFTITSCPPFSKVFHHLSERVATS